MTAMSNGGQLWSVSSEFPTATQNPLTITFYDNFGAITLAEYSQNFKTDSNAAQTLQVTAEPFDSSQFDADADGVN